MREQERRKMTRGGAEQKQQLCTISQHPRAAIHPAYRQNGPWARKGEGEGCSKEQTLPNISLLLMQLAST